MGTNLFFAMKCNGYYSDVPVKEGYSVVSILTSFPTMRNYFERKMPLLSMALYVDMNATPSSSDRFIDHWSKSPW